MITRMLLALLSCGSVALADAADTFFLTDEPGNWFKSDATGSPVSIIQPGDRIDFKINQCCTSTRHTVTLLVKPAGSAVELDQDNRSAAP